MASPHHGEHDKPSPAVDMMSPIKNPPVHWSAADASGRSALHEAVLSGSYPLCLELLETHRESVDALDGWGRTPLHLAVQHSAPAVGKLLLVHGAAANVQDRGGKTPLHCAMLFRPIETVEDEQHLDLIRRLIAAGVDLDARDWYTGETALHLAAREGTAAMAQLLVDAGTDTTAADGRRAYGRLYNSNGTPWESADSSRPARFELVDGKVRPKTGAGRLDGRLDSAHSSLLNGQAVTMAFDRQRCPPPKPKPRAASKPLARSPSVKSSFSEAPTLVADEKLI